jgi:hypothetical protein
LKNNLFCAFFVVFFVYHHLIYLIKVKLLLSKINTELLACTVFFQFSGDSEDGDGGSDNEGCDSKDGDGGRDNDGCDDEEDDENSITNSLSPYYTESF